MGESWLHEAVCRQRPELWVKVGYMKLYTQLHVTETETGTVGDSWLQGAVNRQRPELWVRVGYMKLCVDRDLNCG